MASQPYAPIVIVDDEDAADEPSSYPEPDSADEEINLPEDAPTSNPDPPQPREPRRAVTGGKVRRVAAKRVPPRGLPALPGGRPRGKDIRREFELRYEAALWPSCLVHLPHADLVKVMSVFPRASSVELAASTADHFEVSGRMAGVLRRRFAAMVAVEQDVIRRIRRLLPVSADADAALSAVRRISELCSEIEQRKTDLPFE